MKPILEKISWQYAEKAAVISIDVGIHTEQMARFNVKVIPVEVFSMPLAAKFIGTSALSMKKN